VLMCSGPDRALAQAREPLHGVVADLRLVSQTLPSTVGWTPASLPAGAVVPGRGFGVEGGAQVLLGPGRHRRLGLGVSALVSQGRSTGPAPAPTVTTRFVAAAPHVSMNFGHALGWSHLSLGVGTAKVTADYAGGVADPTPWGTVIHYGFGGRWFLRERMALSLDLRFWALTPRPASTSGARPSAPATTRVALGAGVAFR
jgi:hypothetical protein